MSFWFTEKETKSLLYTLFVPQVIPPYNGFGSLEDSLQNCLSLIPEPPKKDVIKLLENDNKVLRYVARLVRIQLIWIISLLNIALQQRKQGNGVNSFLSGLEYSILIGQSHWNRRYFHVL